MEVLSEGLAIKPDLPFIMISGHGTVETAVEASKKGAFDFISKPPDLNRLLITVRNALQDLDLVAARGTGGDKLLLHRHLAVGTRITVTLSVPGSPSSKVRLTVRSAMPVQCDRCKGGD